MKKLLITLVLVLFSASIVWSEGAIPRRYGSGVIVFSISEGNPVFPTNKTEWYSDIIVLDNTLDVSGDYYEAVEIFIEYTEATAAPNDGIGVSVFYLQDTSGVTASSGASESPRLSFGLTAQTTVSGTTDRIIVSGTKYVQLGLSNLNASDAHMVTAYVVPYYYYYK